MSDNRIKTYTSVGLGHSINGEPYIVLSMNPSPLALTVKNARHFASQILMTCDKIEKEKKLMTSDKIEKEGKIMKTNKLIGHPLNWAVAKATNIEYKISHYQRTTIYIFDDGVPIVWSPSVKWEQGGPIIENEKMSLCWNRLLEEWEVPHPHNAALGILGPTPLIAAMRCFVASKFGDEIEIPGELYE